MGCIQRFNDLGLGMFCPRPLLLTIQRFNNLRLGFWGGVATFRLHPRLLAGIMKLIMLTLLIHSAVLHFTFGGNLSESLSFSTKYLTNGGIIVFIISRALGFYRHISQSQVMSTQSQVMPIPSVVPVDFVELEDGLFVGSHSSDWNA